MGKFFKKKPVLVYLVCVFIKTYGFSLNWTENTKQHFEDGFFYRSTVILQMEN